MKKLILVTICMIFIIGLFGGCKASSSAAYRPAGSTAAAYQIQGTWNSVSGNVTITINGKEVISSAVGMFSSSKTLEGTYEGHKIMAILTKATSILGTSKMHCVITVDGEVAANFDW